jgi:hypothetical protein
VIVTAECAVHCCTLQHQTAPADKALQRYHPMSAKDEHRPSAEPSLLLAVRSTAYVLQCCAYLANVLSMPGYAKQTEARGTDNSAAAPTMQLGHDLHAKHRANRTHMTTSRLCRCTNWYSTALCGAGRIHACSGHNIPGSGIAASPKQYT